ncbi:hypothetical protein EDC04DRAFT_2916679 [Pisolithus marmoratus]|nr:hypothetical protein EDC04DRAFT_2916679 [Pisolithus marmoratus]
MNYADPQSTKAMTNSKQGNLNKKNKNKGKKITVFSTPLTHAGFKGEVSTVEEEPQFKTKNVEKCWCWECGEAITSTSPAKVVDKDAPNCSVSSTGTSMVKKCKAEDMEAESDSDSDSDSECWFDDNQEILLDGAARPTDREESVNVVEELQDATTFDEIVQFIPIDYLEYIYPLMEDLAFTARLAWISEKSLREQQEHRENGTLPYGISATKPLFVCGRQYSANIRKRYLDIIIGHKEANMKQWQRRLAPETWAPQWKQVVTSAWQTCLSQLNMTPNIVMQDGVEKLIGWRPSDESKENLQQVLNDIKAIGRQVIAVERMKCTLQAEKRELKARVQSTGQREPLYL